MKKAENAPKSLKSRQHEEMIRARLSCLKSVPSLQDEYQAANESLYRWWWECLRESVDYAAALRGERDQPYAGVAEDFGVLGDHFAIWWLETGRFLFGEAIYPAQVVDIASEHPSINGSQICGWHDEARPNLYLRIPLTLDRKEILRQVEYLIDQTSIKRQPDIVRVLQPRRSIYPDQRIRLNSIKVMIQLWRERKETSEGWWQTGERLGHWPQFTCQPGDDGATIKHKHRQMTLALQRLYNSAAKLIDYAARGDFPRVK